MRYRILGSVQAWAGARTLGIGGRRQLKLFAFLLLHPNQAVSSDALLDAVWGPERSAADNRLQMAITRLRKALDPLNRNGERVLRTVEGGYILSIEEGELDADVFAGLVRDGRRSLDEGEPERASELLGEALALWRGPPLAEVAFEDFAQPEIRRLDELRLVALEARIDAELELGHHAQLIGELEAFLAEHPMREHLAAQLMVALYRTGRQGDALHVYHRTRVKLSEELGLEPGPALKALEMEILEQAPSLGHGGGRLLVTPSRQPADPGRSPRGGAKTSESAPSEAPASAISAPLPSRLYPYGPSFFVDRRPERDALARALAETTVSGRRAAFVTGELGIGKTRLVSEIAREAHLGGTLVLAGRCDDGLNLPYQPFVEALDHLIEHAPRALLESHVAEYGDSVARLVPALGSRLSDRPTVSADASESERYVLFRAIEGLFAAACARGSVLVVLEDLHWADLPTLKLLWRLLTSPRSWPLMLLATCRVAELAEDHPLRELLADVHREPHVLRLELSGLATADVAELLSGISDEPSEGHDELARALEAGTNGNPFFITELLRNLTDTGALVHTNGRWQLAEDVEVTAHLPLSITETLARRLRRMGDEVSRCLRVAAVVGEEFDLELVSEVADGCTAADCIDLAVEGAVLIELPGTPPRFRFVHALVQRYLYQELGSARRAQWHKRVALALEARLKQGGGRVAEVARHWVAAGDDASGSALRYAILAGDDALGKLAPDEARRWYAIALELLARRTAAPDGERCDLLVKRGEAERQSGDGGFRETLLDAAGIAQRIGYDTGLVRAALANTRGMQSETGIVDRARIDTLGAALQVVGESDSAERARLLAMSAAELMYSGELDHRVRLSDEALAIARRLDEPAALSEVLNMRFVTLLAPKTLTERRANTLEAIEIADRLSDPIARFFAYHWCAYASIEAGDIPAARSWAARERAIADRFRQPTTVWLATADEANFAIIAGELETASRLAGAALEVGHSEPDALVCYAAQQASIAFDAGGMGELIPLLGRAVEDNPGVPGFRATLALALSESSRVEEARRIFDRSAKSGFRDLPYDVTWLAVTSIYAHVSAKLGEVAAARTLYEMLEPSADQIVFPAFGVWGPVAQHLGSLASVMGEKRLAERHLAEAVCAAREAGAPLWQARAERQLAELS